MGVGPHGSRTPRSTEASREAGADTPPEEGKPASGEPEVGKPEDGEPEEGEPEEGEPEEEDPEEGAPEEEEPAERSEAGETRPGTGATEGSSSTSSGQLGINSDHATGLRSANPGGRPVGARPAAGARRTVASTARSLAATTSSPSSAFRTARN